MLTYISSPHKSFGTFSGDLRLHQPIIRSTFSFIFLLSPIAMVLLERHCSPFIWHKITTHNWNIAYWSKPFYMILHPFSPCPYAISGVKTRIRCCTVSSSPSLICFYFYLSESLGTELMYFSHLLTSYPNSWKNNVFVCLFRCPIPSLQQTYNLIINFWLLPNTLPNC